MKNKKKIKSLCFILIAIDMILCLLIINSFETVTNVVSKAGSVVYVDAGLVEENTTGLVKSGTIENFAKNMPVGTVFFDTRKASTGLVGNDAYTLETNGNSNIIKWVNPVDNDNRVVYKGPNGNGIPASTEGYITNTGINNTASEAERSKFTIKFKDVVTMQDTTKKDVAITISNIYINNQYEDTINIFYGWRGTALVVRPLDNDGNAIENTTNKAIGMHCDVNISVLNKDGTPLTGETMLFEVNDLDVRDYLRYGNENMYYPKINDDRYPSTFGNISAYDSDYREAIYILSGALSDAYMPETNWLEVKRLSNGEHANGLRFSSYGPTTDSGTLNTGLLVIVDTKSFDFRWYGSIAKSGMGTSVFTSAANHIIKATSESGGKVSTDFNFNTSANIITDSKNSSTGTFQHSFADGVDVNYIMEADENHDLGKITIDTVEFTQSDFSSVSAGESNKSITVTKGEKNYKFTVTKDSTGRVTKVIYTFENNNANHEISVTWNTIPTSLIIKYLEKGTGNELAPSVTKSGVAGETYDVTSDKKTIENYTFEDDSGNTTGTYTRTSSTTPIEVIYYYKLSDYEYNVEYYYDGEIDNTKTVTDEATYGSQVTTYTDKVIPGYKFDKTEGLPLTISNNTSNNIIKVYYVKRTDLGYTVNYIDKDTNKTIHNPKVVDKGEFDNIIQAKDEIIDIDNYKYDSSNKEKITITEDNENNILNLYYTRKTGNVTIKYIDQDTNKEIVKSDIINGKVEDDYIVKSKEINGYELVKNSGNTTGKITEKETTVVFYYKAKKETTKESKSTKNQLTSLPKTGGILNNYAIIISAIAIFGIIFGYRYIKYKDIK